MHYITENSLNNITTSKDSAIHEGDLIIFNTLFNQDLSDNSKKALAGDLKHFIEWYVNTNREIFNFKRLMPRDLIDYKKHCQITLNHKPASINRRLTSIRALCKVAIELKVIQDDPTKKVKSPPSQPLAPKGLSQPELRRLIKEVEIRGNLRDRLIVEMLCGSGLRVSELVGLTIHDIHLSDRKGSVTIRHGKGNKYREVPLKSEIRALMNEYLERYKPTDQVFLGQRGPLKTIAINNLIEKYAKKAEVKCSPHSLRHSFAYSYLKCHNGDIVGLGQILGHSSIQTTAIYVQHNLETLMEKVESMKN